MDTEVTAERLAAWLTMRANKGLPFPSNLGRTAAGPLRATESEIKNATARLVTEKRLKRGQFNASIDGLKFSRAAEPVTEVEQVKTRLRIKGYCPVADARTVDAPSMVADGTPAVLIVGALRLPWTTAVALSHSRRRPVDGLTQLQEPPAAPQEKGHGPESQNLS